MIYKVFHFVAISLVVINSCFGSKSAFCNDKISSHDKNEANLGRILKDLSDLNLSMEVKNGTAPPIQYKVAVCGGASTGDPIAGAVLVSPAKNSSTVLGRVNNTEAVLGDKWLMVILGDGDVYLNGTNCTGSHVATVLFICNETSQGDLHFVREIKGKSGHCSCIMEVETSIVCPQKVPEETTSHSYIFFVIIFCAILSYFLGGALYRRFALGAKGLEQIPHIAFWSQLVENCRMFCCRRRRSSTSLWHGSEDRDDDSLLQP